jgi:Mg-chelatase subunit ChlD
MNKRPTYEPYDLIPRENGAFSARARRDVIGRNRRMADYHGATAKQQPVLPAAFDVPALVNPTAVAAIRKAFTQAKTSRDAWRSFRREGRFDARQAPRASRMEQDVFKTRTGKSTTRVKCAVLIDASGSMMGSGSSAIEVDGQTVYVTRAEAGAMFGATIAKALGSVPTIDLDVFRHSASHRLHLKWVWHRGTPVSVFNNAYQSIGGGGNADGHALYAITDRMVRGLKRGEHGVILVVSDGMPSVYAPGGSSEAGQALIDAVAYARKRGITVLGVAIDGSDQSIYYGDGLVTFTGSWTALGASLGRAIGAALAVR